MSLRGCLALVLLASSLACCMGGAVLPTQDAVRRNLSNDFVPALEIERVYQPDWAGPVLFSPGAVPLQVPAHRFRVVEGEWVVPKARPTINCSNPKEQTDGSSIWIALDGWMATFKAHAKGKNGKYHTYDSTDILQAGSESDVPCYHGGPLKNYRTTAYFWIEWSGKRNIRVSPHSRNLPLRPGDAIYVRIDVKTTGPHAWQQATLRFVNETTGLHLPPRTFHSGCIDCGTPFARPATLFGDTVEWMTEATFYSSIERRLPNTLDDFGRVDMSYASATDQDGVVYEPGRPKDATPNVDWMTWNGIPLSQKGTLLACSAVMAPRRVSFSRAPYVIATPGQQGQLEPKPQDCRR